MIEYVKIILSTKYCYLSKLFKFLILSLNWVNKENIQMDKINVKVEIFNYTIINFIHLYF